MNARPVYLLPIRQMLTTLANPTPKRKWTPCLPLASPYYGYHGCKIVISDRRDAQRKASRQISMATVDINQFDEICWLAPFPGGIVELQQLSCRPK
ncbi:hypothetical protein L1887_61779 [Cichorium endivia]|nr:hypothetical protein L1887_61779 [Cichorium endivia]